jgi:hypothetical protein
MGLPKKGIRPIKRVRSVKSDMRSSRVKDVNTHAEGFEGVVDADGAIGEDGLG